MSNPSISCIWHQFFERALEFKSYTFFIDFGLDSQQASAIPPPPPPDTETGTSQTCIYFHTIDRFFSAEFSSVNLSTTLPSIKVVKNDYNQHFVDTGYKNNDK